jgi:hypothetical protein
VFLGCGELTTNKQRILGDMRVIEDHQAVPALCRQIHRVIAPATSGVDE